MNSIPAPQRDEDERFHTVVATPLGPLRIVATSTAVVGVYHGRHDPLPAPALLGHPIEAPEALVADDVYGPDVGAMGAPPVPTIDILAAASRELDEYFGGSRRAFGMPTAAHGTPFQTRVWSLLRDIPYGERRSYRDIATGLGNPGMGRAIGAAVRANPLSIIIPGHRVVSSTGAITGYAAGIEAKTALLELERTSEPPLPPAVRG